jgi:hypothetical protein
MANRIWLGDDRDPMGTSSDAFCASAMRLLQLGDSVAI